MPSARLVYTLSSHAEPSVRFSITDPELRPPDSEIKLEKSD